MGGVLLQQGLAPGVQGPGHGRGVAGGDPHLARLLGQRQRGLDVPAVRPGQRLTGEAVRHRVLVAGHPSQADGFPVGVEPLVQAPPEGPHVGEDLEGAVPSPGRRVRPTRPGPLRRGARRPTGRHGPSRPRQVVATAGAVSSSRWKPGRAAARSRNSAAAGAAPTASASDAARPGTGSGGTGQACSPSAARRSRLVASTVRSGQRPTSPSTSRAAVSSTCSQLSTTSSRCRACRKSATPPRGCGPGAAARRGRRQPCGDGVGRADRGHLGDPGPVSIAGRQLTGHPDGQAGLAHPSRSHQRHHPGSPEHGQQLGHLPLPVHEARRLRRQVAEGARSG